MPLFKLTPNYSIWPKAGYKADIIIIRAHSKSEAMKLVKLATFSFQPKARVGKKIHNPWLDRSYAALEVCTDEAFSKDGPDEILSPGWLRECFLQANSRKG